MTATPWRPTDPLPGAGTTVIDASAGTGKTFAIETLVTRLVAEDDLPIDRLLVVTFTRAATSELRDRVRQRLGSAARTLRAFAAGADPPDPDDDPMLAALATLDLTASTARLDRAVHDLDAAAIATIHAFCADALQLLGHAVPTVLQDERSLIDDVVDDLYLRGFHALDDDAIGTMPKRGMAVEVLRAAMASPDATLRPDPGDHDQAAVRARLAVEGREEATRRKHRRGLASFDDLQRHLLAVLTDPTAGAAARAMLRQRFPVALVDEFQDTDPTQLGILRAIYDDGGRLLVVGDPKQSIYAFRGADVHTYLRARQRAHTHRTLDTNRRSDGRYVDACDAVFTDLEFGTTDIAYQPVHAHHPATRLTGSIPSGLQFRIATDDTGLPRNGGKFLVGPARDAVATDVARVAAHHLDGTTTIRRADGKDTPVVPRDIAVLVRTNVEAALVHRTLLQTGIPAVINGVGDVLGSVAAEHWLVLLEALTRPSDGNLARRVALGPFMGISAAEIAAAVDDIDPLWDQVHGDLHRWAGVLRDRGVAALLRRATVDRHLGSRLLASTDGRRTLADLEHVGELLHATATAQHLSAAALAGWLAAAIDDAQDLPEHEDNARRMESDADAVQILTVHRSKGLQFPIVLAPYLWGAGKQPYSHCLYQEGEGRILAVGGGGSDGWNWAAAAEEIRGEQRRLAYVALTRAEHRSVVWWVNNSQAKESGLGQLLPPHACAGTDKGIIAAFDQVVARAPAVIDAQRMPPATERFDPPPLTPPPTGRLRHATLGRRIDRVWRRGSFSSVVGPSTSGGIADEPAPSLDEPGPEEEGEDQRPDSAPSTLAPLDDLAADDPLRHPLPLGGVPFGTAVGLAIHGVLEDVDFTDDDLEAALLPLVVHHADRERVDLVDPQVVAAGLVTALQTPLGPLADGRSLAAFARVDRLDEMAFELPAAGGDQPTGSVPAAAMAELLRTHLPASDPVRRYADRLAVVSPDLPLRGFLAGRPDLILRLGGDVPRFFVVDYKTNWLGRQDGDQLCAWHYHPSRLVDAMIDHHYVLQALLYQIALHRFLRWRLDGYDPDRHLGGILYLYLRGMTGPDGPAVDGQPCGVFAWRPPAALVEALDRLMAEGVEG